LGKLNLEKIRISLASPEAIKKWSYGEVKKPETINYRTLKPEKDGLFCEKIFGPVKDWECHCGKYKRIRYKNIKCEACGVEVTQTKVRRERMGHIQLAAPVSHIWYFKGTPSRMSYLLGISVKELERVLYYGDFMVTEINEEGREELLGRIESEKLDIKRIMPTFNDNVAKSEWDEDLESGKKHPIISNIKVCDADLSRNDREEIQGNLKRLQGRFAEDSEVTLKTEKKSGSSPAVVKLYKKIGDEEKLLGYLPQIYSKHIIPLMGGDDQQFEPFIERITKGLLDRRRLGIRLGLRFKNKATRDQIMRNLNARFQECEDVYTAIYLDEGVSLIKSIEVKKTLQTGMVGSVYKFSDGRVFKAEDRIFEEVYDLDFYHPRPYDLLQTLIRHLAETFNDSSINNIFSVDMGAQAVKTVLQNMDLDTLCKELRNEIQKSKKQKRMKLIKRLTVVEAFRQSKNKPEWMILDVIPVLPPDIRPMVQLEGGRFASSDLNDLYRRVINRNNRLKKLIEIKAPESIIRNEKRMLQEAVDALIDNGRRGRVFTGSHKRPLKSLSELLKGKQGRFRQNLLGKRVDYSGRSVIVVGPELKLHQCGMPKEMALELFKPFVMHDLVETNIAPNIKSAKKIVERTDPAVWDVLERIVSEHPVLLNRAPTLHRLGIQAFQPVLIEGKAIQIHPLVCAAFNADFDGDQMAVHVPLSMEAQAEARLIMLSSNNLLLPANGRPIVAPSQDIVLGINHLTLEKDGGVGEGKIFSCPDEVQHAYELGFVELHAKVKCRIHGKTVDSTAGRMLFNNIFPEDWPFINEDVPKKRLSKIITKCLQKYGQNETVRILDDIKKLGFHFATKAGLTISIEDIVVPENKTELLEEADSIEKKIDAYYNRGLLTVDERHKSRIDLWTERTEKITRSFDEAFEAQKFNPLFMMAKSGARGTIQQIRQLAGIRGLMYDPTGRIIDFPIKSNFREGLSVLEYFISTHGARKGLADTALRTADSGYLTRRLVDVAQDVVVQELDCGTSRYIEVDSVYVNSVNEPIVKNLLIKDVKVTKSRPAQIKEDKVYPFDNIQEIFPTIKKKGKERKIFLKKIYPQRNDRGEVVSAGPEGRTISIDMKVVDFRELQPLAKELIEEKIIGRIAGDDIFSAITGEVFVRKDEEILEEDYERMCQTAIAAPISVRSVLECQTRHGVCAKCYGRNFATGKVAQIGDAVGVMAAQSIGEPGTQLTMRTFHTGGVSGEDISDITQGLPRVEELFEARRPKKQALMSEVEGKAEVKNTETGQEIVVTPAHSKDKETTGRIRLKVPPDTGIKIGSSEKVAMGQQLTDGHLSPHDILKVMGITKTQEYITNEVITVYRNQGVGTNEKHVEVIVREMLRKIRIEKPGDTDFLPNSLVDRFEFDRINRIMQTMVDEETGEKKRPATGKPVLLGITKCSLSTHSFLSAASFQETTRVLTDAAVKGKVDPLMGLKENVIIGNLIPAGTGLPSYRDIQIEANPPELPEDEELEGAETAETELDLSEHLPPLTVESPAESGDEAGEAETGGAEDA